MANTVCEGVLAISGDFRRGSSNSQSKCGADQLNGHKGSTLQPVAFVFIAASAIAAAQPSSRILNITVQKDGGSAMLSCG